MEAVGAVVRVQDTVHVVVAVKLNADQIPCFFLIPIGADPDALDARYAGGVGLWQRDDDFNLQGDVVATKVFSHVNGVGVRSLIMTGCRIRW